MCHRLVAVCNFSAPKLSSSASSTEILGRPEEDENRRAALTELGNGLAESDHHEDALSVLEAELSLQRRIGAPLQDVLIAQGNLASTYKELGREEEAMLMREDVYSRTLNFWGEEHRETLLEADNYAIALVDLERFEEARSLMRKLIPVARRILGESDRLTLKMRWVYADALYLDDGATLDDLREAVTTLEDAERIARRVLGGAHPITEGIENHLRNARAALRARETPPSPPPS